MINGWGDAVIHPREFLSRLFQTAIATADPIKVIAPHLPPAPTGRLIVIGAGKASARMAEAVEAHYGKCEGLVITRYGYERPTAGIKILSAAHPVPDQAGVDATKRMLNFVSNLSADDLVIALISGGGSALLCAPKDGLSLERKQECNAALLASGAPIGEMNILRKYLSKVKGGKLAASCFPAQVIALMISDVPGDDMGQIASGPTLGVKSTQADALYIRKKYLPNFNDLDAVIMDNDDPIAVNDAILARTKNMIVAAPSQSLEAAAKLARTHGFNVQILGDAIEGEAREIAHEHAVHAIKMQPKITAPMLILSGGELTVTRKGDGIGGPNAEYALAMAIALDGCKGIWGFAGDTDGIDGAAEVAGAYIHPETLSRADHQQISPTKALAKNDAHRFFEAVGDQIITGPTLTNVNDFRAILVFPLH